MKNKGYTLLELLGVIVILALLVTLAFPSIINFIKKADDTKTNITNDLIITAAEDYINDNSSNLYLTSGTEYCISVDTLTDKQYLNVALDDDSYSSKSVKVTYDDKTNYEIIDSKDCSVCKLVSGNYNEIGSKYQCKVKDNMESGFEEGYYFYLLSTNYDGTINLIMERNMYYDETNDVGKIATAENLGLVAWYSSVANHAWGPVTAMTYLHNATKDWNNIPNMAMNYEDENIDYDTQEKGTNGYGSIVTIGNETIITSKNNTETGRIENLKTRMPRYDEVHGEGKCLTYKENGSKYESCPLWLVNYLNNSDYYKTENGKVDIEQIVGYWTLSSATSFSSYAWHVHSSGIVNDVYVYASNYHGIRPVITVENRFILD